MAELLEYKCPCCGGAISFDSTLQKLKCPYCDTEFETSTLRDFDDVLKAERPDDLRWDVDPGNPWDAEDENGLCSYVCKSCGGEIVGDRNTAATSCPFCGNPVVVTGNLAGTLKPELVIPFQLDKEAAKAGYLRHIKGKRLIPKLFAEENHIDEIRGIYIPFWLFDADTEASMRYRGTRVRSWSDSRYHYTETSHFAILREGTLAFSAVPVDGSSKAADDLMESIEPYDLGGAVDFQTAYLAGYFADKYDVTAVESIDRANARIKRSTEQVFRNTVHGFATVTTDTGSVRIHNGNARYALYPVWLLNTTWNGKQYTFAMNGQTGKFVGDLPLDWGRYWKWFGILTAIGTAAAYAAVWLVNML